MVTDTKATFLQITLERTILYSSSHKGFNGSCTWNATGETPVWQEVGIAYAANSDEPQQTCLKGKGE